MIHRWCQQFKAGWELNDDEQCPRYSIEMHTDKNKHRVERLILSDCWAIVTELEAATRLVRCQIYQFIHELGSVIGVFQNCSLKIN